MQTELDRISTDPFDPVYQHSMGRRIWKPLRNHRFLRPMGMILTIIGVAAFLLLLIVSDGPSRATPTLHQIPTQVGP